MKKKVDLNKILGKPSFSSSGGYGEAIVLLAMKKACEEVLLLAAENADTYALDNGSVLVDKKSILNTINQVKWK